MKHPILLKTTLTAAIALTTMMGIAGCQWSHDDHHDDRDHHDDPHFDDSHHDDAHVDVHADDHSEDNH
jgi:hypothetical protein